jgi:octaprenyl-diphosphate synthase
MPQELDQVRAVIEDELKIFDVHFKEAMKSNVGLLDRITYYIAQTKGKQVRPMFVLLCAKTVSEVSQLTYNSASLIELLHTASLVHDDVVDDSNQRRGFFSINALWKNKISVLVGDFFFSKGFLLALEEKNYTGLHIISKAVKELSEGEILQIEKARKLDIEEDVYFDIIRQKTASLIGAACSAGAASVTEDEEIINRFWKLGENIGIAFQIKDDLFDYGTDDIGKPLGIDIKEQKMTLPLIYVMNKSSNAKKRWMKSIVKRHNTNKKKVNELIDYVKKNGGMEYATTKMHEYKEKAISILHEFQDNEARRALEKLIVFSIERKK